MPDRLTSAEERLIREFADANPRKSEIVFKLMDEIERLRRGLTCLATGGVEEDCMGRLNPHVAAEYVRKRYQETAQRILEGTEIIT